MKGIKETSFLVSFWTVSRNKSGEFTFYLNVTMSTFKRLFITLYRNVSNNQV